MRITLLAIVFSVNACQRPSVAAAASESVPGVVWQPKSVVTADFSCRGRKEQAILGVSAKDIVVAVFLNGLTKPPELLRYSTDVRDPGAARLTTESLDYDPKDDVGDLPGFRRSQTCMGLNLTDDRIDSVHIYWNHDARRFEDWTR